MISICLYVFGKDKLSFFTIDEIKEFYEKNLLKYYNKEIHKPPIQRAGMDIINWTDIFKIPSKGDKINDEIITDIDVKFNYSDFDKAYISLEINVYTDGYKKY